MWNIECHDLSHVNEELSKVNKVQQAKLVAQQHGECAFACLMFGAPPDTNEKDPYMIF